MTPYIQIRNGQTFEFKATFKDKRFHEKLFQRFVKEQYAKLFSDEEIAELQNSMNLSEEEQKKISAKYSKKAMLVDEQEAKTNAVLETICNILKREYALTEEEVYEIINELYEDYGQEQVNERFEKILDTVFTQLGIANHKTMPAWGMEI